MQVVNPVFSSTWELSSHMHVLEEEFDSFRYALFDARLLYTYAFENDDIYTAYQKYEMNPKVLKK